MVPRFHLVYALPQFRRLSFILVLTILGSSAPTLAQAPLPPVQAPLTSTLSPQMPGQVCPGNDPRAVLCTLLAAPQDRLPISAEEINDIRNFYADRDFAVAWSGPQAQDALNALARADVDGLNPLDYRPASISGQSPAERDILLTAAILRYARDLRYGRVRPAERGDYVDLPAAYFDAGHELSAALARGGVQQFLAAQRPSNPQYAHLTEALALYRDKGDSERAERIIANMERWRWMPHTLESRYIMANEAASELEVVDNGSVILSSRVIVGRPSMPSPIIHAVVRGIIVNPPWNVPPNIARREILPKGRHYLATHGFVWRGDGQIQQRPGARSALGRVKLDMPNAFNVYLHDTPGKALFARDNRNLSHGCIRVQAILPLAGIVVAGDADTGQPEVEAAIARHATRSIPAQVEIPVYFAYWTAVADDNGEVQFYADVYGRDARVLAALHRSTTERVSLASDEQ